LKTYLLDSDVIIAYLRGLEQAVDFVSNLLRDGAMMGCCSVNVTEIYAGMRKKERNITEKLINSLRFFSANLETAKLAGDMIRDHRSKGITLALADAIIAAVVTQNDLILVTYNKRHYTMPGIALISPDESSR
jgi:predicted nucleic acid-binding protein